jgi:preprotein translocase SecE subunit
LAESARGNYKVARQVQNPDTTDNEESLARVFFRGFFWPLRMLGRGVNWLAHRPPLRQIGHGLRWFFSLRFMRIIGRGLGFSYIRGSARELKQVTWPTRHEGLRLTSAVIIFSVIFGVMIALVDFGLDKLFKQLFLK